MSEQLTSAGVSGLLAMLTGTPAATGHGGAVSAGGALPFGTIMQAQGVGFQTPQLDANGQPLPQLGGSLPPPSGEVLTQMQAQIDARAQAPALSQLSGESLTPDLRAALLKENQLLRDGVVMEPQWPGVLPQSTALSLQSPEVLAVMQDAFEGHSDAQLRLDEAMESLQALHPQDENNGAVPVVEGLLPVELEGNRGEVAAVPQNLKLAGEEEAAPVLIAGDNTAPAQMLNQVVSSETDTMGVHQSADVRGAMESASVEQPSMTGATQSLELVRSKVSESPESTQSQTSVDDAGHADAQIGVQAALSNGRMAEQVALQQKAGEAPVIDSQGTAGVAAAVMRESQSTRNTDGTQRVVDTLAGSLAAKDSHGAATALTAPAQGQVIPAATQSAPGALPAAEGGQPAVSGAEIASGARQESSDRNAPLGTEDGADGWLRADTRTASQTNAAVDNLSRMAPSQAAFTLAGKGQMGSPAWNQALNERVMVMTAQNNQVAEIQLDPPELGSLKVRLQVGQDQVSVSFTSPHASVRDAVEQSLPRLREMMEEQGLNMGESSVNDQSSESGGDDGRQRFGSSGNADGAAGSEEAVSTPLKGEAMSLVDYYA